MEQKLVLLLSLLSLFLLPSSAQFFGLTGLPPCVPVLSPCLNYLHADAPPPSCCIPLENAIEEEGNCLCSAFQDKNLLAKVKMTQDEMLKFPGKCGLSLPESSNCTATSTDKENQASPPPSQPPTSPSPPPPSEPVESGAHGKSLQSVSILFLAVILPLIEVFLV